MTPVTMYYKLTASPSPKGSYLTVSQGIVGPHGQPPVGGPYVFNGEPIPVGIFVVLAAVLLGVTFWVLKRRDA